MRNRKEGTERERGSQEKLGQERPLQQGQGNRGADLQRMMRQLEQGLGGEAAQAVKKLGNAQQLEAMLKGLSDKDMARLESLMKHPERLRSLLTPENLQKLKDTSGG